jgi:myo-inositol catabolism protein IolS
MKYRKLGKAGLPVSMVAMGCWALAGDSTWGRQDDAASIATVHAALDAGINFFDTAEGYGEGDSESVLGRALAGRRQEAVIATKASRANLSAESVREACEGSLRRLRTDYIDLYQIHWPSRTVPLDETIGAMEQLREEGKVLALGVCNFGVSDLAELLALTRVETNQLPYSVLWRAIENKIQPACMKEGVGILCYSPLMQGLLTGKFSSPEEVPDGRARTRLFSKRRPQARHGEEGCEPDVFAALERIRLICTEIGKPMTQVALAWLLHQPGVTAVLAGARRPDQIRQAAQAAGLELSLETISALTAATEEVKQKVGPNPDMWAVQSRFR